jgi:hypothetical protein
VRRCTVAHWVACVGAEAHNDRTGGRKEGTLNIGEPRRVIEIEPVSVPVPEQVPVPAPEPEPDAPAREPVENGASRTA